MPLLFRYTLAPQILAFLINYSVQLSGETAFTKHSDKAAVAVHSGQPPVAKLACCLLNSYIPRAPVTCTFRLRIHLHTQHFCQHMLAPQAHMLSLEGLDTAYAPASERRTQAVVSPLCHPVPREHNCASVYVSASTCEGLTTHINDA